MEPGSGEKLSSVSALGHVPTPTADLVAATPHQVLPGPLLSLSPRWRDTVLWGTSVLFGTHVSEAGDQGAPQGEQMTRGAHLGTFQEHQWERVFLRTLRKGL